MKKKMTTNRFCKSFLPGIFLSLVIILILFNAGCSKETVIRPLHQVDSSFYFTLNISGKTYTSYAWQDWNYPLLFFYTPSIHGIFEDKSDPTGAPINWDLGISVWAEIGPGPWNVQSPSTFNAGIAIHKKGDLFGQYTVVIGSFSDVDGKSYRIDTTASDFTITSMSPPATSIPSIDGNFDCTVYEVGRSEVTPIHAYGSFRLKAF